MIHQCLTLKVDYNDYKINYNSYLVDNFNDFYYKMNNNIRLFLRNILTGKYQK